VVQQFVLPRVSIQIGHVSVSIGSEDTSVDGISVDGTSSEPACMRWSAAASAGQSGEFFLCPIVLHAEQRGAARCVAVAI